MYAIRSYYGGLARRAAQDGRTISGRAPAPRPRVSFLPICTLTSARLFTGETATDVIAAVVTREPAWDELPVDTPVAAFLVLFALLWRFGLRWYVSFPAAALVVGCVWQVFAGWLRVPLRNNFV